MGSNRFLTILIENLIWANVIYASKCENSNWNANINNRFLQVNGKWPSPTESEPNKRSKLNKKKSIPVFWAVALNKLMCILCLCAHTHINHFGFGKTRTIEQSKYAKPTLACMHTLAFRLWKTTRTEWSIFCWLFWTRSSQRRRQATPHMIWWCTADA